MLLTAFRCLLGRALSIQGCLWGGGAGASRCSARSPHARPWMSSHWPRLPTCPWTPFAATTFHAADALAVVGAGDPASCTSGLSRGLGTKAGSPACLPHSAASLLNAHAAAGTST